MSLASIVNGNVNRVYDAMTRDISMNGMGLLQAMIMARGETFLACLPLGKEEMVVKCKVTFCRNLAAGIFGVGAEFTAKVDPQALPPSDNPEKPPDPPAVAS